MFVKILDDGRDPATSSNPEGSEKHLPSDNLASGMWALHRMLMHMLLSLDQVSRENGLRYFLTYGTLIGAVRERSLIDWDVDVDVFVPVDDYAALCDALQKQLPDDLSLYSPHSGHGYENTFARIGFREVDHKMLRIDLYPLGRGPESLAAQFLYSSLTKTLNLAYMLKLVPLQQKIHYGFRKRVVARIAKVLLAPIPAKLMLSAIEYIRNREYAGNTLADSCGWFGRRQFFDEEWFRSSTMVGMGSGKFPAPEGFDHFLRLTYGDYMTPPPADQQEDEFRIADQYYLKPLRQIGILDA